MIAAKDILRLTSMIAFSERGKFRNNLIFFDLRVVKVMCSVSKKGIFTSVPWLYLCSFPTCQFIGTGMASGGSCFSVLWRKGCIMEDVEQGRGNWDSGISHQVQIKGDEHKHMHLKWFPMPAKWLEAIQFSLLRWGAEQRGAPLIVVRGTFLGT